MTTIYEINAPNFHAQATQDPEKGWLMSVNGTAFIPLTPEYFTEHEIDLAIAIFTDPTYPDGLKLHLHAQRAAARRKKTAMLIPA